MSRLFLALELPEELRDKLTALDPRIPGLRWSPTGQLHLTLAFLGEVELTAEEELCSTLTEIEAKPFALTLQDVGTFGGRHPTIVWAGVVDEPLLYELQQQVEARATQLNLIAAAKPFHPHITLGRPHGINRARLLPFLQTHAEDVFGSWLVTDFKLFASDLSPQGAIHTVRKEWELRGETF